MSSITFPSPHRAPSEETCWVSSSSSPHLLNVCQPHRPRGDPTLCLAKAASLQCRPRGAVHLDPRAETSLKRGADSNPPPPGSALTDPAGNYLVIGRSLLSTGVRKHAKLLCMFLPNLVLQNQIETIVLTSDVSKMGPPSKALAPSAPYHTRSRQESRKSRGPNVLAPYPSSSRDGSLSPLFTSH